VSIRTDPRAAASKRPVPEGRDARSLDHDSREWVRSLRASGATRDEAIARLHALLLRAACFKVARRRPSLPHLRDALDEVALEAAADALVSVLARVDDFRADSRSTTWAYKFALLEAAVKLLKRSWQEREVPLDPKGRGVFASADLGPDAEAEQSELLTTLQQGIAEVLTPHQRRVLVALALNGAPIDVLADRLDTSRGALYKRLHDARRHLRTFVAECGLARPEPLHFLRPESSKGEP